MKTPEEIIKLPDSELMVIINSKNQQNPYYDIALREHCRRQEAKETHNNTRISTSIRWSKIAGIAAIVGIVLMIFQIILSVYQYKSQQMNNSPKIQQPTKNQENLTSSSTKSPGRPPSKKIN